MGLLGFKKVGTQSNELGVDVGEDEGGDECTKK